MAILKTHPRACLRLTVFALVVFLPLFPVMATAFDIVPVPSHIRADANASRFEINGRFSVGLSGSPDARVSSAVFRALRRIEERSGLLLPRTPEGAYALAEPSASPALIIECGRASSPVPQLGEDESYALSVTAQLISLRAPTTLGVLRGLETLVQLVQSDSAGWFVPAVTIQDQPRFPWRGLMIDVCRHWQPIEVIKRNLEGMALVKLNVLHLHLTEDQGFRIESRTFPRLHELGSDGHYFTQDQMREIIAYAAERGIRVLPEFDMPGHAQSWVVGYPELASAPGPYVIQRRWGVFDAVLDPTNEKVYELLEGFLGEMAALFPDAYLHIGGDENNGVQWSGNPRIQNFIRERRLKDNAGLHAYFNHRVQQILEKHGKKLIGWDEILHPELSKDAAVQSWRGPDGLAAASRAGHAVILSNGYYIDLLGPAGAHYLTDPVPAASPLSLEEQARVLGGEATMWAEWVSPETIDSRIWPRAAAIAERLWSPREIADVDDLYRRLDVVSRRLTEIGLLHEVNLAPMLQRYAGDRAAPEDLAALRQLLKWIEPVKGYRRNHAQNELGPSQFIPLTGLIDIARPDSSASREFTHAVERMVFGDAPATSLKSGFNTWRELAGALARGASKGSYGAHSAEVGALADQLAQLATLGENAISASGASELKTRRAEVLSQLGKLGGDKPLLEFPAAATLKLLVVATADSALRSGMTPEQWRHHVSTTAFPPERH